MSSQESGALGDEKHCIVCGRRFGWRVRWASEWATIQHCGSRCARRRLTATDAALEQAIVTMLERSPASTPISPNEAARSLGKGWRALSERARDAARRLASRGAVEFVQGDRLVDASSAKGPIQVRRRAANGGAAAD